jgi:hypothetical protein
MSLKLVKQVNTPFYATGDTAHADSTAVTNASVLEGTCKVLYSFYMQAADSTAVCTQPWLHHCKAMLLCPLYHKATHNLHATKAMNVSAQGACKQIKQMITPAHMCMADTTGCACAHTCGHWRVVSRHNLRGTRIRRPFDIRCHLVDGTAQVQRKSHFAKENNCTNVVAG